MTPLSDTATSLVASLNQRHNRLAASWVSGSPSANDARALVTDIVAARGELVARGLDVSDVEHLTPNGWVKGPDPERSDYNSFAHFSDPDGNTWVLQERGGPGRS